MKQVKHLSTGVLKTIKAEKNYLEKYEESEDIMYIQSVVATATLNKNNFFFTEECLNDSYKSLVGKPIKAWRIGDLFTTHKDRVIGYIMESHLEKATDNSPMKVVIVGAIWKQKFPEDSRLIEEKHNNGGVSMSMECTYFVNDEIANIEQFGESARGAKSVIFDGAQIVDDPADTLARIQRIAEQDGISLTEFTKNIEEISKYKDDIFQAREAISDLLNRIKQVKVLAELKKDNTIVYNEEEVINNSFLDNNMNKQQEKASIAESVAKVVESLMQQHELSADEVMSLIQSALWKIEDVLRSNEMFAEASQVSEALIKEKEIDTKLAESVVSELFATLKSENSEIIQEEALTQLKNEIEALATKDKEAAEDKKEENADEKTNEKDETIEADKKDEIVNEGTENNENAEKKEEEKSEEKSQEEEDMANKKEEIQKSNEEDGKIVSEETEKEESEKKEIEASRDSLIIENEKLKEELAALKAEKLHNERFAELSGIKAFEETELEGKSKTFLAEIDEKDYKIVKLERQLSIKSEAKAENVKEEENKVDGKINLGEVIKEDASNKSKAEEIAKKILSLRK